MRVVLPRKIVDISEKTWKKVLGYAKLTGRSKDDAIEYLLNLNLKKELIDAIED